MTEETNEKAVCALYERFVKTYIEHENNEEPDYSKREVEKELGFDIPQSLLHQAIKMMTDEAYERSYQKTLKVIAAMGRK